MKTFKFSFLLVSDKDFYGERHDPLLLENQASSMITGIYIKEKYFAQIEDLVNQLPSGVRDEFMQIYNSKLWYVNPPDGWFFFLALKNQTSLQRGFLLPGER